MEATRARRVVLVSLAALVLLLPMLWSLFASAGSQEYGDDDGEIEKTLQGTAVLLLFWSLIVGAVVRSLWLCVLVSAVGGAAVLGGLCAALALGYRTLRPSADLDSGFWAGAAGIGLRGLGLAFSVRRLVSRSVGSPAG